MGTEIVHLCSKKEQTWFDDNLMSRYIKPPKETTIDAPANLIRIRCDVHWLWDQLDLVFVPKSSSLVAHAFSGASELIQLYHNVELHPLPGRPAEYLLARFAWALFLSVRTFLMSSVSRLLLLRTKDGQDAKRVSSSQCRAFAKVPSRASK